MAEMTSWVLESREAQRNSICSCNWHTAHLNVHCRSGVPLRITRLKQVYGISTDMV
jgi:hypothetical protein